MRTMCIAHVHVHNGRGYAKVRLGPSASLNNFEIVAEKNS
jgi:hypothetical protein